MKTRSAFSLMVLALLLAGCAGIGASGADRTVSVTGEATVHATPDIVTIDLGVQTQDPDVVKAVSDNNRAGQAIVDAAKSAGVAEADIQTTNFSVYSQPPRVDQTGAAVGGPIYFVNNTFRITIRQADKLGAMLQSAVTAGANQINGISYSIADPSGPQDQARVNALADARARAEQLAKNAGATLGAPILISATAYSPGPGPVPAMAAGVGGGSTNVPVSIGSLDIQAQVTVTYTLQ